MAFRVRHPGENITAPPGEFPMINKQRPIESGFDGTTTAMQALAGKDLHGMTAIVTGGYSGIGLEAVLVAIAHHRGNSCRTRASPNRSSINITTPWSCWLRITRPAACTTF